MPFHCVLATSAVVSARRTYIVTHNATPIKRLVNVAHSRTGRFARHQLQPQGLIAILEPSRSAIKASCGTRYLELPTNKAHVYGATAFAREAARTASTGFNQQSEPRRPFTD